MWRTKKSVLVFLTLGVFLILVQCRLEPEARLEAERECIEQSKIDPKIVSEAVQTVTVPDDEKYKTYLSCFFLKQGFRNAAGEIQFEELKDVLLDDGGYDKVTAENALYPCKKIASSDVDDLPVLVLRCLYKNLLEYENQL